MSSPENLLQPSFANVSELLFSVVHQAEELDVEAERRLYQDQDTNARYEALKAKALLIHGLPSVIKDFKKNGGDVPYEVEDKVLGWSLLAGRSLDTDNVFGMSILLVSMISEEGEPDQLTKLAVKHRPEIHITDELTKLSRRQKLNLLAPKAQNGDKQAIQSLFENATHWTYSIIKNAGYFTPWGNEDDLCQEGLIGCMEALENWDSSRGSFVVFAELAIKRQIYDAIKQANRVKHSTLNSAVSLDSSINNSGAKSNEPETTLADIVSTSRHNPVQDAVISSESVRAILKACSTELSPFESAVIAKYMDMDACSWVEIAESLENSTVLHSNTKITPAVIDNALQRAKRKLAKFRN
jgi:RNA polymerase sporulation-specific sigma factor